MNSLFSEFGGAILYLGMASMYFVLVLFFARGIGIMM